MPAPPFSNFPFRPGWLTTIILLVAAAAGTAEIDLGKIETEESRAAAARHEEKINPATDGWDSEAFADQASARLAALK